MSIKDRIKAIFDRKQEQSAEYNKETKIAENKRKLFEMKGNEPFEANHMAHEFGLDGSLYIGDSYDENKKIRIMTIVNPIYKFTDNENIELVGGRVFERDKFYVGEEHRGVIGSERTIKTISAQEFKELQQQKIKESQMLAKKINSR